MKTSRGIKSRKSSRSKQARSVRPFEINPLGDSALVIRVATKFESDPESCIREVAAAMRRLEMARIPGILEVVPAFTSVSVIYDPAEVAATGVPVDEIFDSLAGRITDSLKARRTRETKPERSRPIELPVCYDPAFAPDLARVAAHAGMSPEEVVGAHSAACYRAACIGFSPGFPYLAGLPSVLATPRRGTPRKKIAAGSVAIGGVQAGIYSRESPGGWNVIGRTPRRLFDVTRDPPSLLAMGDAVRFRRITRAEYEALME